ARFARAAGEYEQEDETARHGEAQCSSVHHGGIRELCRRLLSIGNHSRDVGSSETSIVISLVRFSEIYETE
ncbi:MAG TPA: hypothetical protein VIH68_04200, partial [Bacteroidota bacterium]